MPYSRFLLKGVLALAAITSAAPTQRATDEVDYVLVGAGPAGFVVAEYLTRDPSVNVVLLEAGPDENQNADITTPAQFFFNQPYFWDYYSQPDANLNGRTPDLWQGRVLGGGSGVNAMFYCRGSASVFDEWADISGNEGLRWDSMFEAFRATTHWTDEDFIDYNQLINETSFGNGPLEITRQRELFEFDKPFADKIQDMLDLPRSDFCSGGGIGVSQGVETIQAHNRTRSFSANTYGYMMASRPNYQLHTNAWASKIGFTGKTADRVTYTDLRNGTEHTIHAREIIVTAGAINSPQLLMLSGVGPADRLRELNISVVEDIPEVGQNLVDHHMAFVQYEAVPEVDTAWQWQSNETRAAIERDRYAGVGDARIGDGLLGMQNGDVYGALRLPDSVFQGVGDFHPNLPADRPQVVYQYAATPFLAGSPNVSVIAAWAAVVQPESKGYVTLASPDYRDAPLMYSQYWSSESDRAAIMYGYRQLRGIMRTPELRPFLQRELFPGPDYSDSDEDIWRAIQDSSLSWHHPIGTTALGTVLDADWRVKGLNGLRVVGASSAPTIPTCAIQATAYAMAHRAAMDIAADDCLRLGETGRGRFSNPPNCPPRRIGRGRQ